MKREGNGEALVEAPTQDDEDDIMGIVKEMKPSNLKKLTRSTWKFAKEDGV